MKKQTKFKRRKLKWLMKNIEPLRLMYTKLNRVLNDGNQFR